MGYFDMKWRLCACRVNAGYTQKEVADMMGISQSYISRLEKRIMQRLRRDLLRQVS